MTATSLMLPQTELEWRLPVAGASECMLDRRRSRDLHDLRGGVPLLCWQEPHRTHAEGRSRATFLLHGLPAFEQSDDSLRRQSSSPRQRAKFWCVVASDNYTRCTLPVRNSIGVAPSDLQGWPDDQHQLVRNHLLLAGRAARFSRGRWPRLPDHCDGIHAFRSAEARAR